MQHFFVDPSQIRDREIRITGEDVKHIRSVLRMHVGEEISVSNGIDGKEYRCEITEIRAEEVLCRLRFIKEEGVELPVRITLFQGLPKADKMELIIQKAVELGACGIVPVATTRSVVKLDAGKAGAKTARWQAIAEAAAKQSKRAIIPEVSGVRTMHEAVKAAADMELAVIPYELEEGMEAARAFLDRTLKLAKEHTEKDEEAAQAPRIGIFIGPEGGFTEEEIELARESGIGPISLGKRILRTETAGMALISALMLYLETDRKDRDGK